MTPKVVQLIVDNAKKPEPDRNLLFSLGMSCEIVYADDKVVLMRYTTTMDGEQLEIKHTAIELTEQKK